MYIYNFDDIYSHKNYQIKYITTHNTQLNQTDNNIH